VHAPCPLPTRNVVCRQKIIPDRCHLCPPSALRALIPDLASGSIAISLLFLSVIGKPLSAPARLPSPPDAVHDPAD
jgi:hypothetical protein